jgi:prevent-host-death family protein
MVLAVDLLKSPHVGLRELREGLSSRLRKGRPIVVTDRGVPKNVIIPYDDMMELLEMLEELSDTDALDSVREGRQAMRAGGRGIPFTRLAKKIRAGQV